MKKYSWIVALLFALSLAFIGCDGGGGGGGNDDDFTSNLGAHAIVLTANEHEPLGFQFQVSSRELMQGNRVSVGEEYILDIEFTLSRDINDDLLIYLVDNTDAASPSWWGRLTCTSDDDADRIEASYLKAGTPIAKTITMTAVANASAAAPAANKLVFETKNEAQSLPSVTMTFTKFIFARGSIDTGAEPPPPPPELEKTHDLEFAPLDGSGQISEASWAAIQGAKPDSVIKLFIQNNSGASRNGWGIGHFGDYEFDGGAGEEFVVEIPADGPTSRNTNIWNECVFVKAELWQVGD